LFEQWMVVEREHLHGQALEALAHLAAYHEEHGAYETAVEYARRQVALEPWREGAHRQWMRALALGGQRGVALAQYEACQRTLAEELGVAPSAETQALYERIRDEQELHPASAAPPHNLPAQLTPFIGREDVLSDIGARLGDSTCRLLTLVGPGGSGKTRLALEVAARQRDRYPDGVFFVSLAPLWAVDTIVPTIAQAIQLPLSGRGDLRQQLIDHLRRKEMLLILDNYEHLVARPELGRRDGVGLVIEVLRTAPLVKVVATSRVELNVQGECLYPVSGMALPPLLSPTSEKNLHFTSPQSPSLGAGAEGNVPAGQGYPQGWVKDAARYSAVQFFVMCAHRAQPGFKVTVDNVGDVVRICHLVAGMPLGILLAAAWIKMLTPAEIADQIAGQMSGKSDGGLDFLETDQRGVPVRQRSMRAVYTHSWSLLSTREQEVLARLSVFRGGFMQEAARAVAGASLRMLFGFVSRSLVQRAPTGRYEMHELLRQYAAERLSAMPGEVEKARDLHSAYYAEFLYQRETDVFKGLVQKAMREIDNIRAGWDWAVRHGKASEILKSSLSLRPLYFSMSWVQEGEAMFGRAVDSLRRAHTGESVETRDVALGLALGSQSFLVRFLGDAEGYAQPERATQLVREGLSLLRKHGAGRELAMCTQWAAHTGLPKDDSERQQLLQESLAISQEIGFHYGTVYALRNLGRLEESLRMAREANDRRGMAFALHGLGEDAYGRQAYAQARSFLEEALAFFREAGVLRRAGGCSNLLGDVALALDEYEKAGERYREALAQFRQIRQDLGILRALDGLGNVALAVGDSATASRRYRQALEVAVENRFVPPSLGVALSLDVVSGIAALLACTDGERAVELAALSQHHPSSTEETRGRAQRLLDSLQTKLSPAAFAAAQERGRARDLAATMKQLFISAT
jgi:predicted ATPase